MGATIGMLDVILFLCGDVISMLKVLGLIDGREDWHAMQIGLIFISAYDKLIERYKTSQRKDSLNWTRITPLQHRSL